MCCMQSKDYTFNQLQYKRGKGAAAQCVVNHKGKYSFNTKQSEWEEKEGQHAELEMRLIFFKIGWFEIFFQEPLWSAHPN